MRYVKGHVACLQKKDGSRFPNGRFYLYSEPHPTHEQAQDWADAFEDCNCLRIEENDVHPDRLVAPLRRINIGAGTVKRNGQTN